MTADEPHPEVQALLEQIEQLPVPPTYGLSVESSRKRLEALAEEQPVEDVAGREEYSIPGPTESIPIRAYVPPSEGPHPVLLYFHGGGWVQGGLDTHDNVCAALTNRAECLTLSVGYRLAPEHPFPAGLEDAFAAAQWAAEHATRLDADPDRIAVGGDSAGGNLAAATTLLARDHGGPEFVHQLLIYPAVASPAVHVFDSYRDYATGYLLETETMDWFYDRYFDSSVHVRNEYAAPLLVDDLSGLPPATVVTAGFDPLRDEGTEYADRLAGAAVSVEHRHYPEMIHGFVSFPALISRAGEALEDLGADVRDAFA